MDFEASILQTEIIADLLLAVRVTKGDHYALVPSLVAVRHGENNHVGHVVRAQLVETDPTAPGNQISLTDPVILDQTGLRTKDQTGLQTIDLLVLKTTDPYVLGVARSINHSDQMEGDRTRV